MGQSGVMLASPQKTHAGTPSPLRGGSRYFFYAGLRSPAGVWGSGIGEKGGSPLEVQAECPWCGMVTLRPKEVRCEADPRTDEALCEIDCPVCHRVVYARTTAEGVKIIRAAGAIGIEGLVPFELLERHNGPALLWDEVLDVLERLETTTFPQAEVVDALGAVLPRAKGASSPDTS